MNKTEKEVLVIVMLMIAGLLRKIPTKDWHDLIETTAPVFLIKKILIKHGCEHFFPTNGEDLLTDECVKDISPKMATMFKMAMSEFLNGNIVDASDFSNVLDKFYDNLNKQTLN